MEVFEDYTDFYLDGACRLCVHSEALLCREKHVLELKKGPNTKKICRHLSHRALWLRRPALDGHAMLTGLERHDAYTISRDRVASV